MLTMTTPSKLSTSTPLALLLGLGLALGACGDDMEDGGLGRIVEVDTLVQPNTFTAGGSAQVACAARNASGDIITDVAFTLIVEPPGAATISGMSVATNQAGDFTVACHHVGATMTDPTPAPVAVSPGPATQTVLTVEPSTIAAGAEAQIACFVADAHGNPTGEPSFVASSPAGVTVSGAVATATQVGAYELLCDTNAVPAEARATATLTVTPGPLDRLGLVFLPEARSFALGQVVRVEGVGLDAHGNVVEEGLTVTGLTVEPGGHHTVLGDALDRMRFDLEGVYTVTGHATVNAALTASADVRIDQTRPVLTLTSPERGEVHDVATTVTVAGTVTDNLGELESLTVNGEPVTIAPTGAFSVDLPLRYGLNLIEVVATDPGGHTATATRATEKSTEFFPMLERTLATDGVDNAAVLVMTQELVDDGDRDEPEMDDLATLFKVIVDNIDVSQFVPNPLTTFNCIGGSCTLAFSGISYSASQLALTLQHGRIHMHVGFDDFAATITLFAPCSFCSSDPQPLPGSATASRVTLDTDIVVSVVNGEIVASAENTVAEFSDFGVNLNDPTGLLQGIVDGAVTWIEQPLITGLEQLIEGLVEEQVGDALGGLFDALNVSQAFEIPSPVGEDQPGNTVHLDLAPQGIDISPERLQLRLDGIAFADTPVRPFPSLGSIGHGGCATYTSLTFPPPSPMIVGLHDSFINQLLFAVWEGGTLSLDLGPGEADGLISGFPIADLELSVQARLPPVFNSCPDPSKQGEGTARSQLQLGDLYVDAKFNLGGPVHLVLWIQAEAAVDVAFGLNEEGGAQVALVLGDIEPLILEIVTNEGFFAGDDAAVVALLKDTLLPELLGTVGESARFDLPAIDLGALTGAVPEGTVINLDVEGVGRDNAYLTVHGKLK